jgi:hypothetical protein
MKLAKGREEKGPHNLLRLRRRRKMEKKCDHEKLYLTFSSSPLSEEAIGRRRCASISR